MSLTTGIISYWKFDENTGTTAFDSVGSNNGTIPSDFWKTNSKINSGLAINRVVNTGTTRAFVPLVLGTSNFTINFWTLPLVNFYIPFGYFTNINNWNTNYLYFHANGSNLNQCQVAVRNTSPNQTTVEHGYFNMDSGYNMITITREGTTIKTYKNNILQTTNTSNTNGTNLTNGFYLGGSPGPSYNSFDTDEIGIWNRALTQSEITELYNNGNGLTYPFTQPALKRGNCFLMAGNKTPTINPIAEALNAATISAWNFDEGSGTTAFDSKGSNNGTLSRSGMWDSNGLINSCVNFNRSQNDKVDISSVVNSTKGKDFNVEIWFYTGDIPGKDSERYFIIMQSMADGTFSNHYTLIIDNTGISNEGIEKGALGFFAWSGGSVGVGAQQIGNVLQQNTWCQFIANFKYNSLNNYNITCYLNGVLERTFNNIVCGISNTNTCWIGRAVHSNNRSYDNKIDIGNFKEGILSQQEITYLYNNGAGRQYPY